MSPILPVVCLALSVQVDATRLLAKGYWVVRVGGEPEMPEIHGRDCSYRLVSQSAPMMRGRKREGGEVVKANWVLCCRVI